ncbi:uncharacterized protein LOC108041421 [Drosophila rhopaloa]|uniref:Uncharacterized protein LOC108041421 n=1 Tax=Drosophila rhopaloa TaxID=1041015 RepID=A0A6P4EIM6_DRORH|nr:uncharacterized protein LOC108041421 [Drosophila rhopaloa]
MDEFLNLSVSHIQYELDAFEEDEGESDGDGDGDGDGVEAVSGEETRLLYYFSRLYDILSGNIFLTTYVERGRSEYFAGFSNVHLVAPFQDDQQTEWYHWIHLSLIFRASRSSTLC